MGILVAIIVGGIVGWIASLVMKTDAQMGLIANILIGIVGSSIGHYLANALGLGAWGTIGSLIVSIIGAVVLIAILRALGLFR